jgi:ABC-type sugar transport system ATPase subunit
MIAGLEEIGSGDIFISGKRVNNMMPKERDIAMVFQNYALYPHMTVRDNMAFSLMLAKQPKSVADERVMKAANILGLVDLLDRFPRQLSGGQRQRVAMGRCIVRDPQVFLFDEPLSNLDAKLRVQMRTEIKELHQRLKTTSVYVTHDQIEAMTMADKIVVMRDGLVEQTGSPLELYDFPANQFVAGFIGSPSMNFLPGVLRQSGGTAVVELAGGLRIPAPIQAGGEDGEPAGAEGEVEVDRRLLAAEADLRIADAHPLRQPVRIGVLPPHPGDALLDNRFREPDPPGIMVHAAPGGLQIVQRPPAADDHADALQDAFGRVVDLLHLRRGEEANRFHSS